MNEQGPTMGLTEDRESAPKLVRALGAFDATMIVIGSMIGSGIFITSAESSRMVGTPGLLLAAWALAGLMTMTGALCCAEVAAMMPRAGGQYVFLREAYSPIVGFLFGWSTFLVVQTGTIAAVSVAFAKFLGVFLPAVSATSYLVPPIEFGPSGYAVSLSTQQLVAVGVIAVLTGVNLGGLRFGKWIQNTFTFTKTAALIGLIVVGLTIGYRTDSAAWTASWWQPTANGWSAPADVQAFGLVGGMALAMLLGKAMIGPLFSQTAWNSVTFTGAEIREPGRSLPRALLAGCGTVVALYLLANVAYLVSLPLDGIRHAPEDRVGTAMMLRVLGPYGGLAMAGAILISTFGCVNGLVLSGARVYYAMACDGLFFARVGTLNRFHVPAVALVAQGVWAALLTLPRTVTHPAGGGAPAYGNVYNQLLEFIIPADMMFYAIMVGALVVLRFVRPDAERPYRTFAYPLPPIIYLTMAALLILDFIILAPGTSGMGFALVLTGVPVYLLWRRPARAV
jgi:APA family basic amino acid/polyamine antiporter